MYLIVFIVFDSNVLKIVLTLRVIVLKNIRETKCSIQFLRHSAGLLLE